MKYKHKNNSFYKIYKNLKELYSLHKIQQEALWICYDENRDYGHVFAIDAVYKDKFQNILNKIQKFI